MKQLKYKVYDKEGTVNYNSIFVSDGAISLFTGAMDEEEEEIYVGDIIWDEYRDLMGVVKIAQSGEFIVISQKPYGMERIRLFSDIRRINTYAVAGGSYENPELLTTMPIVKLKVRVIGNIYQNPTILELKRYYLRAEYFTDYPDNYLNRFTDGTYGILDKMEIEGYQTKFTEKEIAEMPAWCQELTKEEVKK